MRLDFGCAEGKVGRVAGHLLQPVRRRDVEADLRLGDPAALRRARVAGVGGGQDPAPHQPLDRGRGVGVGRLALEGDGLVDAGALRPSYSHRIRSNYNGDAHK